MATERLLIVQPVGGLANRLRVLASADITARASARELRLRWEVDAACGARWEELFENALVPFAGPLPEGTRTWEREPVNFAVPGPGDAAEDPARVAFVRTFFNFKPRALPMASFVAAKGEFYRRLVPVAAVRERVAQLGRELAGRPVVGVHIRRTDLVLVAGDTPEQISPTALFVRRMRELVDADPSTLFFLATDDRAEAERLLAEFPGRILTRAETEARRDTVDGMCDALVDWLMLARTQRIVRSAGTSFSREAAIAGRIPRETIQRPFFPYDRLRYWREALRRRIAVISRRLGRRGARR